MEPDPLRLVPRPQGPNRIGRHRRWRWDLGQGPTVRPPEPQRVVGQSLELISLLVDRAMVAATEQREICQGSRAALRPVAHVMALPDPHVAAREATAPVAMQQRPPQGWRNRPGPGPDLHQPPFGVVPHHHPARVTGQAPGRFRGNVAALFQHGLAGLLRVRKNRGVHVDHHLVPLAGSAGIELVV